MDRASGKKLILQKVQDFQLNERAYMNKSFQETEARNRFIDPFFQALGWELDQTKLHRDLWDVHREYSQKDNSSTKKPDYAFRINKKLKFFVEAKAPWVPLTDKDPVFQAKRYAFSTNGKAPIVIITDFQEFRVFNALQRPIYDNPLQGLLKEFDFKYTDYMEHWDDIYNTFSKEAVLGGSIEKLAGKITKSTKTLDSEFLEDIIEWREHLAKNLAIRNKSLDVDSVNEAVQRILDRLIFIRNLEDREIEAEGTLFGVTTNPEKIYSRLIPLFRKLDIDYNGLLFKKHFSEELDIDDKVLKEIIKNMCYPISPFQFDVIEPEILGRIYEKFLGSKIRLTESHQAKVEEKPEVRHAGGVYYTPQYIVDYIVENTVGEKIKGLAPEKIEEIKVLDPACGSGSFLLGAFDYLIKHHEKWYAENQSSKKYKEDYFINADKEIKLTLKKKSEILKNNLFGVDIDREATEVAIMSLYLKMLEEGFDRGQQALFLKGHILPDMTGNVKCGNSLISREQIFEHNMFGDENLRAFDWKDSKTGFGEVFSKQAGFDCVIGNPPYIRIQELQSWASKEVDLYKKLYKSGSKGNFDIYVLFIERGLSLTNPNGLFGMILPNKFFMADYGESIRSMIHKNIYHVVNFGDHQVFANATTYTNLLFLNKKSNVSMNYLKVNELNHESFAGDRGDIENISLSEAPWNFSFGKEKVFFEALLKIQTTLNDITEKILVGLQTSADPVYILEYVSETEKMMTLYSKSLEKEVKLEKGILKPLLKGKEIKRYSTPEIQNWLIFPYSIKDSSVALMDKTHLENKYPRCWQYLMESKAKLGNRDLSKGDSSNWWQYGRNQNIYEMSQPKLITQVLASKASFTEDLDGRFCFVGGGNAGGYGVKLKKEYEEWYHYVLGVLNSAPIDKYLRHISTQFRGGFYSYAKRFIEQLPIYLPDPNDKSKYELCQKISELVKQILELKKDAKRKNDAEFLEKKIDEMVCELYGVNT